MLGGCNGPCESLADKICSCEPNRTEELGCLEQVRTEMSLRPLQPGDDEVCEQFLDSCECEALEREEFSACGLNKR